MKSLLIFLASVVALAQSANVLFPVYGPFSNGRLPPLPSQTCINGVFIVADSRHWWVCTNNQWVYWTCPEGTYVNTTTFKCEFVQFPSTLPPTSNICTPGSTRPDVFDNSKFERCSNYYEWVTFSCPLGAIYDPTAPKLCSWVNGSPPPTTSTTTTTEKWCKAGFYKADPKDCRKFYQCDNGQWKNMNCGRGTGWDQLILGCNHIESVCTGDFKPISGREPITKKPTNNNGF